MIDPSLSDQLRAVFSDLASDLTLVLAPSPHPAQDDARALLAAVAGPELAASPPDRGRPASPVPHVAIMRAGP